MAANSPGEPTPPSTLTEVRLLIRDSGPALYLVLKGLALVLAVWRGPEVSSQLINALLG